MTAPGVRSRQRSALTVAALHRPVGVLVALTGLAVVAAIASNIVWLWFVAAAGAAYSLAASP